MTKYDYFNNNKTMLSSDGKKPEIMLIKGFNGDLIIKLGKAGRLKGDAYKDYIKATEKKSTIQIIVLFMCFMLMPSFSFAFCFEEAGQKYGVSPQLLWAIAKVESSFNPRAINRSNRNGSYDFGLMQINSSWRRTLGEELWQSLSDPCVNVKVGAWVLANCKQEYGHTWEAVGCYNAITPYRRARYANRVYRVLVRYGIIPPSARKR